MALYYLKGTDDSGSSFSPTPLAHAKETTSPLLGIVFGLIILLASFVQLLGLTWPIEERVLQILPKQWTTKLPLVQNQGIKIALLEMMPVDSAFSSLDIAMALRGLSKLHPARVLIAGKVTSDKNSEQLLQGVLSTLRAEGVEVIQSQDPSEDACYHPLPLCFYTPPPFLHLGTDWETIPGSISNKKQGYFLPLLPISPGANQGLQLFARTAQGVVVGSIWWDVMREIVSGSYGTSAGESSPWWLFGGRLLAIPERSPVLLTEEGFLPIPPSRAQSFKTLSFEDFLPGIEQKERGGESEDFDLIWNDALVILGQKSDRLSLSILQTLGLQLAWKHLLFSSQLGLCGLCIILLIIGRNDRSLLCLFIILLLIVGSLTTTAIALTHGILIPWLPPVVTALLLMISILLRK